MNYLAEYEHLRIDKVCRICLLEKQIMFLIKDTDLENLLATMSINVLEDDRSHLLCINCLSECNKWRDFHKQVVKSFTIGHWLIKKHARKKQREEICGEEETDNVEASFKNEKVAGNQSNSGDINSDNVSDVSLDNICIAPEVANEEEIKIEIVGALGGTENINHEISNEERNAQLLADSQPVNSDQDATAKTHPCPKCNKQFKRLANLKEHIMRHYNLRNFACNICGKTFYKPFEVSLHMKTHTGERPFMCEYCTKTFSRAIVLRNHIRKEHVHVKRFMCEVCSKPFANSYRLKIHYRIHTGEKPFQCSECGRPFTMQSQLKSHIKYKHTKEKDNICNVCGKGFTARHTLNSHLRTHRGEKPKPMHECSQCGKKCITTTHLKIHIKSRHTGERDYICELCEKRFLTKAALQLHTRIHTGERPFVCNDCGKSFSAKATLKIHIRTHTGERPYECQLCDKKYIHANTLRLHEKRAHK